MSARRDDRDHEQAAAWGEVREACMWALDPQPIGRPPTDRPGVYTIACGGKVHEVRTLAQLAEVTRRERARYAVAWPEDPGAKPAGRWS